VAAWECGGGGRRPPGLTALPTIDGECVADVQPVSGLSKDFDFAPQLLRALGLVMCALLFALMILTTIDVAGRDLFNNPLPGTVEYTELGLGILVFGSLPLVTARQEHITIDIFDFLLGRRRKQVQQLVVNAVGLVITAFIGWRIFVKAEELAANGDRSINMQLPLAPVAYFMSVMSVVAALIMLMLALHYLRLLRRPAPR
jgi:TRAP-type C4-dicarboxylate transport system permease small subunit